MRHRRTRQPIVTDTLNDLSDQLERFARERDWGQFHSPKNLASALIVEAAELLEHFQWLTEEQSRSLGVEKTQAVAAEIADVLLYLIQLSKVLGIDPVAAAQAKLQLNAGRFPVEPSQGTGPKHDER
jgi:dCTP diphosphatase